MSGTYLVCDICGNYGPPAGFLVKDGVRLCYVCYEQACESEESHQAPPAEPGRDAPPDDPPSTAG
jgi:hypothetical protein